MGEIAEGRDFQPLQLVRSVCETPENVLRNIARTLSHPYVRFNELMNTCSGSVSVCGSGPSFEREYPYVVGDILACNGAHDFLIERGVIPRFAVFFDAAELMDGFIRRPHSDVTYLIASRCHESVFKRLEGYNVVVWHCMGDSGLLELLQDGEKMEPAIHGGSAAVGRGMVVAHELGYRDCHLFGTDSSFDGDRHHIGAALVPENAIEVCAIYNGERGKWYHSTAWMAGQVEDFMDAAPQLKKKGFDITVHGTGLLPDMARLMGVPVISQGDDDGRSAG